MKARIITSTPSPKQVEMLTYLVFAGDKLLHSPSSETIKRAEFIGKSDQVLIIDNLDGYRSVAFAGLGKTKECSPLSVKNAIASVIRKAVQNKVQSIAFILPKLENMEEMGSSSVLGVELGSYQFLKYKTDEKTKKSKKIDQVSFVVNDKKDDFQKGVALGEILTGGVVLARDLINDPASHTNTHTLVDVARSIEKSSSNISVTVLEEEQCRKLGMGSYLSVARGSVVPPKFIVLHYKPKSTTKFKKIALVGKSIMFDSGGLSLKPPEYLEDMKIDMAGGAAVLGVFSVLAKTQVQHEVFGILPACENMPSGHATRPGDIVTAMNGKTIEVLNTDAEGRLTLADALVYAEKHCKADIIIDLATLTGACVVALGEDLTGMFGNNDKLSDVFEKATKQEGDELWKMPLYMPYLKKMKSDIADLKNIGGGKYGGAITAAVFLSEFVDKAQWIHLDIAGPAYRTDEPKGTWGKGATGWGVLSLVAWLRKL